MIKKLFIAFAAATLTVMTAMNLLVFTASAAQSSYILGDADGDGYISIRDATLIQMVLADLEQDTDGMIELRSDFYGNGLTINCATTIQKYLVYLPVDCNIGEVIFIDEPTTEQITTAQPTTIAATTAVQPTTKKNYDLPYIPEEDE